MILVEKIDEISYLEESIMSRSNMRDSTVCNTNLKFIKIFFNRILVAMGVQK